jgi:NAD(P)-dependent dehydrogenase (short-subunit alcohol dehydrogenase family)
MSKVIIVTGASDGIGEAAARLLKAKGENVVIVGRSPDKTGKVARELNVPFYLADYSKLDDVRRLASQLKKDYPRIDVLANNAGGVMSPKCVLTADGFEMTIQVNHLAPFLLTNLLLDTLIASKGAVISTASVAHNWAGKLDPYDTKLGHGYSQQSAYGKGKLMNILFSRELHKRYHSRGLSAAAYHPGGVRTNFSNEFGGGFNFVYASFLKGVLLSPEQGADTLVWLAATEPGKEWQPGEYYAKRKIAQSSRQASDMELAHDLWESSAKAVGA